MYFFHSLKSRCFLLTCELYSAMLYTYVYILCQSTCQGCAFQIIRSTREFSGLSDVIIDRGKDQLLFSRSDLLHCCVKTSHVTLDILKPSVRTDQMPAVFGTSLSAFYSYVHFRANMTLVFRAHEQMQCSHSTGVDCECCFTFMWIVLMDMQKITTLGSFSHAPRRHCCCVKLKLLLFSLKGVNQHHPRPEQMKQLVSCPINSVFCSVSTHNEERKKEKKD